MASEELPDSVMAPSPTPELHQGDDDTARDPSPDAPDDDEIQKMRQSAEDVQEKLSKGKGKGKGPEAELSDMVLRLTTAALSLRTQVLSQADTIAQLSMQRKYLVQRMDEDKQLWDGERENWSRVAETLVAQLNKASPNIYKEQEYGKLPALIESENVSLRQKLANAQGRLVALENELSHLRPVLLMQPYALSSSHREHRKKKAETANVVAAEADATDATEGEPSTPKERKRQDSQGQYYRQREGDEREGHQRSRRSRKRSYFKRTPTLTDARAEHLLLAARRIGRRRATMLSSSTFQPPESEPAASSNTKGKGRANDGPSTPSATFTPGQALGPLPTTPKTPQKSPTRPPYPPGSPGFFPSAAHPFFVPAPPSGGGRPPGGRPGGMPTPFFVPGPVPGPAYAFYGTAPYPGFAPVGASPSHSSAKSPNVSSTAVSSSKSAGPSTPASRQRQQGKSVGGSGATAASPLTPLDKLLSAAQTVFSPSATPTGNGKRTNANAAGGPSDTTEDVSDGSPTPKRRRIGSTTNADITEGPSARLGRRASALDVLADQAIGSGSADVNDSRSRSGSVSSIASAVSKSGQAVPRGGASRGRGRGRAPRARPTRKRKKVGEDLEEEEPTAMVVPQGRAKSSSRKRGTGTGSRGSSLDPPISLSGRKSTSRSTTPNSVSKRSQLRDIPEEDEDAPHEVDDEMQEVLTQSPHTDSAALVDRSSLKKRNAKNGIARTSEDDVGPESEEEQDGDKESRAEGPVPEGKDAAAAHQAAESDEVHKRWLQKLGLTGDS